MRATLTLSTQCSQLPPLTSKETFYPWATYLLVNAMAKKPLKDTSQHHYALVSKVCEPIRPEKNVGLLMTEANNAI